MTQLTPKQFKSQCEGVSFHSVHPFVHELLGMDERVRLNSFFGDVDPNKGYFVTKKHIHMPYGLPTIQHEISHMLEHTNCKRWITSDWGMPRFEGEHPARRVFCALSREIRTRAIQLHLTRFESEEQKCGSTAFNQLNNVYWANLVKASLPFGRFKTYEDVEKWMCDLRERTYRRWSLDRIHHEWSIRLAYIQNWMETFTEETICG